MTPREIYYFLGKCLMVNEHPGTIPALVEILEKNGFPWERFVKIGSDHLVLPMVYQRFSDAGLLQHLPDDLKSCLEEIHRLNLERNTLILSQIHWIGDLLGSSGINPVFIKGSGVLLEGLYSHPAERMMADIDCLIPGNRHKDAVHQIMEMGYSAGNARPVGLPEPHHFPTLHKTGYASIDLHNYPVSRQYLQFLDGWENRIAHATAVDGRAYCLMSAPDRVMLNFLHSQMQDHGQYYASVSLRSAYEMFRFLEREDLSETVGQWAGKLKKYFNNYLGLISALFYPFTPDGFNDSVSSRFYMSRLDRNKSSRFVYLTNKVILTVVLQLVHYLNIGFKALYRAEYRRYLTSRIMNPSWYRSHLKTVRGRMR